MSIVKQLIGKVLHFERNGNVSTFLVCLAVATVFWFLNAFTKNYSATVKIPVAYKNMPENKVLVNEATPYISVELDAHGLNLLTFSLDAPDDSFQVDVSKMNRRFSKAREIAYYPSARLYEDLSSKIPGNYQIKRILQDTLQLQFEYLAAKMVPVKPHLNMDFENQFLLKGLILSPDSIRVQGPQGKVEKIEQLSTERMELSGLNKSLDLTLDVMVPQGINVRTKEVKARVEVERYTETSRSVALGTRNLPDSLTLVLVPEEVEFTCLVPVSKYSGFENASLPLYVDYNEVIADKKRLSVETGGLSSYIKPISVEPEQVEYILRKE